VNENSHLTTPATPPDRDSEHDVFCSMTNVSKHYGGVNALSNVSVDFRRGQIHALVGENGAGKSTLMKILAGAERADAGAGEIVLNGKVVDFHNVREANIAGIACVFQENSLFPALDVLTNLFIGDLPSSRTVVSRRTMQRRAAPVLERIGLDVALDLPVERLTLAESQLVEIARALLVESSLLILDEPNSALTRRESERLFDVVRNLCDHGVGIVYVSHRLEEIFDIAHSVTVLRNGEVVETKAISTTTIPEVVRSMIGADRAARDTPSSVAVDQTATPTLTISHVSSPGLLDDVSLVVQPGEIVGLIGLDGAGHIALMDILFGLNNRFDGEITMFDGRGAPSNPAIAVRRGIAYVPSDRARHGLFVGQHVQDNVNQTHSGALRRGGWLLRQSRMKTLARTATDGLNVKMSSLEQDVTQLSGGNQQKIVFARWRATNPQLLLLDDPTRGVDIGAKFDLYLAVQSMAAQRMGVLYATTDLSEIPALCHRVAVFWRGRIIEVVDASTATEHTLLEAINTGDVKQKASL